jgi:hypothetical protein
MNQQAYFRLLNLESEEIFFEEYVELAGEDIVDA